MTIDFSQNWNNKLFTDCFTTIRLSDKYRFSQECMVSLNGLQLFKAMPIGWKQTAQLDDYTAYLDTGYDAKATHSLLDIMYQKKVQTMYVYLFKKIPGTETQAYRDLFALAISNQLSLF